MFTIYTDGSTRIKNQKNTNNIGGFGYVVYNELGEIVDAYSEQVENTTNNRMEMKAVILSLKSIQQKVDSITIVSDSQYVIGCATKGWKRKKNVDLWEEYDKAFEYASQFCSDIKFEWVHGHTGDRYNEMVDILAVKASQSL